MILAHPLIGSAVTGIVLNSADITFSLAELNILWIIGILGSIAPDIDLILSLSLRNFNHRRFITHSIVPYPILLGLLYLIIPKTTFYLFGLTLFGLGIFTHFVADVFVGGVTLLLPFSKKLIGIDLQSGSRNFCFVDYWRSWPMIIEILVIVLFILSYVGGYIDNIMGFVFTVFLFLLSLGMAFVFSYLGGRDRT